MWVQLFVKAVGKSFMRRDKEIKRQKKGKIKAKKGKERETLRDEEKRY